MSYSGDGYYPSASSATITVYVEPDPTSTTMASTTTFP
jgi:hypothetical protein